MREVYGRERIPLKKSLITVALACLLIGLAICAGCGSDAPAANKKNTDTLESGGYAENNMEKAKTEAEPEAESEPETEREDATNPEAGQKLTLEILLELYEDGTLAEKVNKEGLDGFLQYQNLKLEEGMEDSLTGLYVCSLTDSYTDPESGEIQEREYEFQLSFWKPETAEEYGYRKNEIDNIRLMEKETGDAVLLYETDNRYIVTDDLRSFLEKEYGIEQYLTVSLPEGYTLGSYEANMTYFSGWLLCGDVGEPIHGDGGPECWYAPGGIGRAENAPEILQFGGGKLTGVSFLMNHSEVLSEAETIEGCETPATLIEYEFDLFTVSDWMEYLEENPDVSEEESTSRYWYIFMGKENSDTYYILFLNTELFSKEEAVGLGRSVRFAEGAF